MAFKVTTHQARYLRLFAQRLICNETGLPGPVTQIVKDVVGIQAQEEGAAYLSIHSRSATITPAQIEHELLEAHSMIRSWFMRGTLHLVASEDLGWLLTLLAPIHIEKNQRRYRELGLDHDALSRGVHIIEEVLASQGPCTRHDLAPYLAQEGVNLQGQALIYLINRAAWEGVLCLGPTINGKQSYVRLVDWIGRNPDEGQQGGALQLAVRYLSAYGPASSQDFSAWSGLPLKMAREALNQLGDRLVELEFPGGTGFILAEQAESLKKLVPGSLGVRMLPKFDTFLLGYDDRSLFVSPQHLKKVNAGGGILRPVLLVNGYIQGIWRMTQRGNSVKIELEPFSELSSTVLQSLEAEVDGIRTFLETEIDLHLQEISV